MRRIVALLGFMALGLCNCDKGSQIKPPVDFKIAPQQLGFAPACPKPTDPSYTVEPSESVLTLSNLGRSAITINRFELDAAAEGIFAFDSSKIAVPRTLESMEELAIPFTFTPRAGGTAHAKLTIQVEEEEPQIITLLGEGKTLPPNPTFSMSCPGGAFNMDSCADASPTSATYMFVETPCESESEMVLTVKNNGCASLKLTNLAIENYVTPPAFQLAAGEPTELTIGGGLERQIRVLFRPTIITDFEGKLSFETNDVEAPRVEIALDGQSKKVQLEVTTERRCGYPNPAAESRNCCSFSEYNRNTPNLDIHCTGNFTIRNTGDQPITLKGISLAPSIIPDGKDKALLNQFKLVKQPEAETVLPPNTELANAIVIEYEPGFEVGSDALVVESTAGTVKYELRGGSPPVVKWDKNLVDFGKLLDFMKDSYYQPVSFKNEKTYNRQLPLNFAELRAYATETDGKTEKTTWANIFTLATTSQPNCQATLHKGDVLKEDEEGSVCVRFNPTGDPNPGGMFNGTLLAKTDDPNAGSEISLQAGTLCNPDPAAEVSVPRFDAGGAPISCQSVADCGTGDNQNCIANQCHTSDPEGSINLGDQTSLVLSGELSHALAPDLILDPEGLQCTRRDYAGIATYEWKLISRPPTSTKGAVTPVAGNPSRAALAVDKEGAYQVQLKVTNISGKASTKAFTVRARN